MVPYHTVRVMAELGHVLPLLVGWVIIYLFVTYLRRRFRPGSGEDDEQDPSVTPTPRAASLQAGSRTADSRSTVVCPHCRTENDPEYTFCKRCVSSLEGSPTGSPPL